MRNGKLVHEAHVKVDGESFQVLVYCRDDGRHFAKTHLGGEDIIINDGVTLEDVLHVHEQVLPLAISTRRIRQQIKEEEYP